jgi:hypothetical protein
MLMLKMLMEKMLTVKMNLLEKSPGGSFAFNSDVWESVCCSREISEGLATGWPIGQPVANQWPAPCPVIIGV